MDNSRCIQSVAKSPKDYQAYRKTSIRVHASRRN